MSAAVSWATPTSSSQAIALLNFANRHAGRPVPKVAATPLRRAAVDLVSDRHRPTTAGMQIRKILGLLERGRLARRGLQKLQIELEEYLARRMQQQPASSETFAGLALLSRAVRLLGNVPAGEIENLVDQAEERISQRLTA